MISESGSQGDWSLEEADLVAIDQMKEVFQELWFLRNLCRNPHAPVSGITHPEVTAARAETMIRLVDSSQTGVLPNVDWADVLSWSAAILGEARRLWGMRSRFESREGCSTLSYLPDRGSDAFRRPA